MRVIASQKTANINNYSPKPLNFLERRDVFTCINHFVESAFMNRLHISALSLAVLLGLASAASQPADAYRYGVNNRQERQQNRIYSGVQNGSLNRRETARLGKQQYALNRKEARFRASGNGMSNSERARLERQQNQMSQNIYQQKHDGQGYNPGPGRGNPNNPGRSLYDVNQTQQNQANRINNGIQNGSLTPQEAARLQNQQSQLAAREASMRASGNGLSVQERARLDNQQDRLSQNIYQQKNDAQGLNPGGPGPGSPYNNRGINGDQANQQARINQGVQSGSLTPQEAQRLQNNQAEFAAKEARLRASGNGLSYQERARLEAEQAKLSRQIYNQKNDAQGIPQ